MKCADRRAVEGQDRESIWKRLFPIYLCLCIDYLLLVLPHLKAQRREDEAVDLILHLIVIIGKISGNL